MALDKATLTASLTTVFTSLDPNKTPAQVAQQIADAVDIFVKSGTVNVTGTTSPAVPGAPSTVTASGTVS